MKKLLIIVIFCALCVSAGAWSSKGHAVVAQIALENISPRTKAVLDKYLGGIPITALASDPDYFRTIWMRDLGCEISNPELLWPGRKREDVLSILGDKGTRMEPWGHSYSVDKDFKCFDYEVKDGVFLRNCVYELNQIVELLKNGAPGMNPEERARYISLVVHLVGDMHCPMHVLYVPDAPTGGAFKIVVAGNPFGLHAFWDNVLIDRFYSSWSFTEVAHSIPIPSKKEVREITKGNVFDWGSASAAYCWRCQTWEGALLQRDQEFDVSYYFIMRPVLIHQLRDAGLRLAKLLDYIFSK